MELSDIDRRLLAVLAEGLPLVREPYAEIGCSLGLSETAVIARIGPLVAAGAIKRFGIVVRHHELGYRANAMTVWDVPDRDVARIGERIAALPFVTLCYRRPRRLPDWPYNLFCMVHGRDRDAVLARIDEASKTAGLSGFARAVLFSRRRFKQRGARYVQPSVVADAAQ